MHSEDITKKCNLLGSLLVMGFLKNIFLHIQKFLMSVLTCKELLSSHCILAWKPASTYMDFSSQRSDFSFVLTFPCVSPPKSLGPRLQKFSKLELIVMWAQQRNSMQGEIQRFSDWPCVHEPMNYLNYERLSLGEWAFYSSVWESPPWLSFQALIEHSLKGSSSLDKADIGLSMANMATAGFEFCFTSLPF